MKRLLIASMLIAVFVLFGVDLLAQRHPGREHRKSHTTVIVKKGYPKRYARNRVVVVHKRNPRVVTVLPNGYTTCVYRKNKYFYHEGYFYRPYSNTYRVIVPPRGMRIKVLPIGYRRIVMFGAPHFYYQGIYYKQVGKEYETVEPEVGTVVPDISEDMAEEVILDDVKYYEIADVLYKPVQTAQGTQYEVAGELEDETNQ